MTSGWDDVLRSYNNIGTPPNVGDQTKGQLTSRDTQQLSARCRFPNRTRARYQISYRDLEHRPGQGELAQTVPDYEGLFWASWGILETLGLVPGKELNLHDHNTDV